MLKLEQMHLAQMSKKDKELALAYDDRDSLHDDVQALDKSFTDLHARFSRLRATLENQRKNEESLMQSVKQYEARLKQEQSRYSQLKKNSLEVVQRANAEIEANEANTAKEIQMLKVELKKLRVQNQSLESLLERKTQENAELTQICDELIANAHQ